MQVLRTAPLSRSAVCRFRHQHLGQRIHGAGRPVSTRHLNTTSGRALQGMAPGAARAEAAAVEAEAAPIPLLTPYQLGPFPLAIRMVYAPLTRNRATGYVPQPAAATYYSQRTHPGGLLISEATVISPDGFGYPHTPGVYAAEHVEAWKPIVEAVKAKGGFFFNQLWHCGRVGHPDLAPDGSAVLAPSPVAMSDAHVVYTNSFEARKAVVPKEASKDDIKRVVAAYRQGARNAISAGFDGVELHGANGYLLDQFLRDGTNKRTDEYGGSAENRARFVLEVVDAVAEEIGKDRVGIRFSPFSNFNEMSDSDPYATYLHLVNQLNARGILYVHMVEARADAGTDDTLEPFRKAWKGTFIAAGGYNRESGNEAIESGNADLIAYGRFFLSNPDLPLRYKLDAPLNKYDRSTFYINDQVKGYTDYPLLKDSGVPAASA